jgi:hypothetical protein
MKRPGLDLFRTFNEVGLTVKRATSGEQQPWVSSSPIDGSFYCSGVPPAAASSGAISHQDEAPSEATRQEARLTPPSQQHPADGIITDLRRPPA